MIKRRRESPTFSIDSYSHSSLSEGKTIDRTLIQHKGSYKDDFILLSKHHPFLKKHMIMNLRWKPIMPKSSMYHFDFNHPDAVYHLSKAIMKHNYNLNLYLPCGCEEEESCNNDKELDLYNQYYRDLQGNMEFVRYLAPCVPNRLSYIRTISSLLTLENNNREATEIKNQTFSPDKVIKGKQVVVLDVGTGASCIYPLLGVAENSWTFIGSEIDYSTMELTKKNVDINHLNDYIKLRMQECPNLMFNKIIYSHELISLTMCNPPFHSSIEKTNLNPRTSPTGSQRELVFAVDNDSVQLMEQSYIDHHQLKDVKSVKGQIKYVPSESEQGELAFIEIMLQESKLYCHNVLWFTSLVAKLSTLKRIKNIIQKEMRMYNMNHVSQDEYLNKKLSHLNYEESAFKFTNDPDNKVDVSQINCCEYRTFVIKLGKQTRWIVAWTYYNAGQRIKIINNLANLSTQQSENH